MGSVVLEKTPRRLITSEALSAAHPFSGFYLPAEIGFWLLIKKFPGVENPVRIKSGFECAVS